MICTLKSSSSAEPYTPRIIPKCEVQVLKDGTKGCVYKDIEDVKKLYDADSELFALRETAKLLDQKVILQGSIIDKLNASLILSQKNVGLFQTRIDELTKKYLDTDKAYQLEKAKPRWGNAISWGIVLGLGAAFTGYVIADRLNK